LVELAPDRALGRFSRNQCKNFTAKLTIAYSATDGIRPSTSFLIVTVNGVAEDVVGTRKDDMLTGTKFGENIYGMAGRDTIKAGAGGDFLFV
jgi:Ca2+-binding RTX toxin-like protein